MRVFRERIAQRGFVVHKEANRLGFQLIQIEPRGEMSLSSSQISFSLNGRPVEIKQSGRQYNYQLTPRKAGLLRIPAPTVTVAGGSVVNNLRS